MAIQEVVTWALATAADTDGIAQSQTPLAGGNLTINGALASGGVATMDAQRQVLFTFAASEVARTFVVYGTNQYGAPQQETVAGAAATATTVLNYKTVTRISIDAASAGAMQVGTNGVGASPWRVSNFHLAPQFVSFACVVTGTVNYTIQYTYDDVLNVFGYSATDNAVGDPSVVRTDITAWSHPTLAALAATADGSLDVPFAAWRVLINSGTGSVKTTALQAGIIN